MSGWALVTFLTALGFELAIARRSWRDRVSALVFLGSTILASVVIALNHEYYIENNLPFQPFIGFKILSLVIALICPSSVWVGMASLGVAGLMPLERYFFWEPSARAVLGIQEPWLTTLVSILAAIIYVFRLRLNWLREAEIGLAAKLKIIRRLANLLVGTQHLLNTPLQTLELLMRNGNMSEPGVKESLGRAFASIRAVTRILTMINKSAQLESSALPSNPEALEAEMRNILNGES